MTQLFIIVFRMKSTKGTEDNQMDAQSDRLTETGIQRQTDIQRQKDKQTEKHRQTDRDRQAYRDKQTGRTK